MNEEVRRVYDAIQFSNPGLTLSHIIDEYSRNVCFAYAVEVKSARSADSQEARSQKGIFTAAWLIKRAELITLTSASPGSLPVPCLAILGHEWRLHIAWVSDQNEIVSKFHSDPLLKSLREELEGGESTSSNKFPAYIDALRASNDQNYVLYETYESKFYRVFIAPATCRHAFYYLRPLLAIDGNTYKVPVSYDAPNCMRIRWK